MNTGRWIECAQCRETIFLTVVQEEMLRRNQGRFFCLWGHSNFFPEGESEATKLRRERDRLKQDAARLQDEIRLARAAQDEAVKQATEARKDRAEAERRAGAAHAETARLKTRAAAGVCPCCNRSFENLRRHMADQHPEQAKARGGRARAAKLTPERRREIASAAAKARWHGQEATS